MRNVRQLTNFDLDGVASTERKTIIKAGMLASNDYYIVPTSLLGRSFTKMGYCCEVKGIAYPIFLTINGVETEFQIGKTGMFEFQEEEWIDVNAEEPEEQTAKVTCSEAKVPVGIRFTLDYAYDV